MKRMCRGLVAALAFSSSIALAETPGAAPAASPDAVAPAEVATPPAVLTEWNQRHPNAAQSLAQWVQDHPRGAHRIFVWDRHHPLRAQAFIQWIAANPDKGFDAFAASHADWPVIQRVMRPHQSAVVDLIAWVQANAVAAKDLESLPRGLAWVGFHVYRPIWAPVVPEAPANGVAAPESK